MKLMKNLTICLLSLAATSAVGAKGLYYVPNDTEETIPLSWTVGITAIYDDNTTPGGAFDGDETVAVNPFVGLSFVSVTPQTTWDVYARLGVLYYLDEPQAAGADDVYTQARAGVNVTHSFTERLRLVSRNFISYELEPDYSYGFATTRQISEYLFYQTDNAIGFRWTERFATYTGFKVEGLEYDDDVPNSDRTIVTLYNQFRYQVSPTTVLTSSYRYSQTYGSGLASDSTNQYFLVGVEHRFSPSTILITRAGAQFRDVDGINGNSGTSPYVQTSLSSQVNQQFSVRAFARYGIEDYDTVFGLGGGSVQFDERATLRIGVSANYQVSRTLSLFGSLDVVNTSFDSGRIVQGPGLGTGSGSADETLYNVSVGASVRFTDYLYGTVTYSYTDSDSDLAGRNYDRNRVSVGLTAEF